MHQNDRFAQTAPLDAKQPTEGPEVRILLTPPPPECPDDDEDGIDKAVRHSGVFMTEIPKEDRSSGAGEGRTAVVPKVTKQDRSPSVGSVKVTNLDDYIQSASIDPGVSQAGFLRFVLMHCEI